MMTRPFRWFGPVRFVAYESGRDRELAFIDALPELAQWAGGVMLSSPSIWERPAVNLGLAIDIAKAAGLKVALWMNAWVTWKAQMHMPMLWEFCTSRDRLTHVEYWEHVIRQAIRFAARHRCSSALYCEPHVKDWPDPWKKNLSEDEHPAIRTAISLAVNRVGNRVAFMLPYVPRADHYGMAFTGCANSPIERRFYFPKDWEEEKLKHKDTSIIHEHAHTFLYVSPDGKPPNDGMPDLATPKDVIVAERNWVDFTPWQSLADLVVYTPGDVAAEVARNLGKLAEANHGE